LLVIFREHFYPFTVLTAVNFNRDNYLHCVSKKRAPFEFLRLFCVLLTDLKIFGSIAAKEICNNTHISHFILTCGT